MVESAANWGQIQAGLLNHIDNLMASDKISRNIADSLQEAIINARSVDDLPPDLQDMVTKQES